MESILLFSTLLATPPIFSVRKIHHRNIRTRVDILIIPQRTSSDSRPQGATRENRLPDPRLRKRCQPRRSPVRKETISSVICIYLFQSTHPGCELGKVSEPVSSQILSGGKPQYIQNIPSTCYDEA